MQFYPQAAQWQNSFPVYEQQLPSTVNAPPAWNAIDSSDSLPNRMYAEQVPNMHFGQEPVYPEPPQNQMYGIGAPNLRDSEPQNQWAKPPLSQDKYAFHGHGYPPQNGNDNTPNSIAKLKLLPSDPDPVQNILSATSADQLDADSMAAHADPMRNLAHNMFRTVMEQTQQKNQQQEMMKKTDVVEHEMKDMKDTVKSQNEQIQSLIELMKTDVSARNQAQQQSTFKPLMSGAHVEQLQLGQSSSPQFQVHTETAPVRMISPQQEMVVSKPKDPALQNLEKQNEMLLQLMQGFKNDNNKPHEHRSSTSTEENLYTLISFGVVVVLCLVLIKFVASL